MGMLIMLGLVISCSGSGTGGTSGAAASATVRLSGSVVATAPVVNTAMALRDSEGRIVFLKTGPTGSFDAALGLKLPVILRAPNTATGKFMYSYASAEGTANIHPLTDPILRVWFRVKGPTGNIDNDFITATPFTLPTANEIAFIKAILTSIVRDFLRAVGLNPDNFDLITSTFAADATGFDKMLKGIRINATDTGAVNILVSPGSPLETDVKSGGFSLSAYLNSAIISLATDTTPPAPPAGLAAAAQCGGKSLITWSTSTSSDVASYLIYEAATGTVPLATVTYTAFVAPKVVSQEVYTYSARAVDVAGNISAESNTSSVDFTGMGCALPPFMPTALSSAPSVTVLSSSQVQLDWSAIPESGQPLSEYRIYSVGTATVLRATTSGFIGAIGKTFTDFQLDPGTQYCYVVTLVDFSGLNESDPSPLACGTTLPGIPPAPKNVQAASGPGTMTVSWDAVGSASFYKIYVASLPGITKENYTALPDGVLYPVLGTSYSVTGLTSGKTYYAVVTAVTPSGEGAESVQVQALP